jgi:pyruvate ferredoxin oxidoreductase gamma subunit
MELVDVLRGLKNNGKILINTTRNPNDLEFSNDYMVATVDATGIAIKNNILVGGIPVVNTPILGAVPKILSKITLQSIQKTIVEKWGGELQKRNISATRDAYETTEVNF